MTMTSQTTQQTTLRERALEMAAVAQVAYMDRRERGATAVEYALMIGLIGVAIIAATALLGDNLRTAYGIYGNTIP
jgi:pilus assembly protein Flp/PilA